VYTVAAIHGDQAIISIKPLEVERRIKNLPVSKKTKSHIKAQIHHLFEFAMKAGRSMPIH